MLSIIIPFVVEMPQLIFTLQALSNELLDKCDYEILCVDNRTDLIPESEHTELNGSKYIASKISQGLLPNIKLFKLDTRLSHWQAKNLAVKAAVGDTLLFLDAHVIHAPGSILNMLRYYQQFDLQREASLHLPISYMLDMKRKLVYDLVYEPTIGKIDYKFTPLTFSYTDLIEVPCMSTCGMMLSRSLLADTLKGWPSELGAYSGGEQYINFTMGIFGLTKYVLTTGNLFHYAAPRSYQMDPFDVARNKAIAYYLVGDESLLEAFAVGLKGETRDRLSPRQIERLVNSVVTSVGLQERREYIKATSVEDIHSWCNKMLDKQAF